MVDKIMKRVDLCQQNVLKLQTTRHSWTGRAVSTAEINIFYDEIVEEKTKITELYEDFFLKKDASTDPAHEATFETVFSSIKTLQLDVGEHKRQREVANAVKTKTSAFKLEKIKLPEFGGKFSEWQDFQDLFVSAVENNPYLSESEKMVYLKSSLVDEAASIVASFSTSSSSFANAWALVKKRYINQREIVFSHIRKFDELKPVQESSLGLRTLTDSVNELIRSLEALKVPVVNWDPILIYLALKKLDPESKKEWLLTQDSSLPVLKDFIDYIEKRATALADSKESAKSKVLKSTKSGNGKFMTSHHSSSSPSKSSPGKSCLKCGELHYLHQCKGFQSLQPGERRKFVKDNHLCFNCLFKGHSVPSCKITAACKKCGKKHHSLIHAESVPNSQNVSSEVSSSVQQPTDSSSKLSTPDSTVLSPINQVSSNHSDSLNHHQGKVVLFETGIGLAIDTSGERQQCRIFFDPGSECHFVTENCLDRLGLPRQKTCVQVGGIGGSEGGMATGISNIKLFSKFNDSFIHFSALVMKRITKSMPKATCSSSFTHLQGLQLADPSFFSPGPIDILIGAPLTGKIKMPGYIVGPPGLPDAQNTIFGWVLSGQAPSSSSSSMHIVQTFHSQCSLLHPCLDSKLQKFWQLEEIENCSSSSSSDQEAEKIFTSSVTRNTEGRYSVRLPFQSDFHGLGESKQKAIHRFVSVEKSLSKNVEMKQSYHQQFQEFISNGLMEEVPAEEIHSSASYYLPHHVVSKLDSTSTKFRIVFDASSKSSNALSLNNVLHTGPKIQTDLFPLLIRFRTYIVAMSADIVKFYNQFLIQHPDYNFQRLVYRQSPDEEIRDYRMLRVTFGLTCAPYLAIRCLHELAEDYKSSHPLVYPIIKNDFLVDNLLTGAATIEEARIIQSELIEVLSKAKLQLRKWTSSHPAIVNAVPEKDREYFFPHLIYDESTIKTIGILWNPSNDSFSIKLYEPVLKSSTTKRQVLSSIAKTFDPLGWLSPVTIRLKILLQDLWKEKLDWDSPLPSSLFQKWNLYCNELPSLKDFSIPRCITTSTEGQYQLHGFSDASNVAYAACLYLKINDSSHLVTAKTKVAPVNGDTIPRLELCGAWLLAKLVSSVLPALHLDISAVYCWTDSNIVLGWLNSSEKLPVFINNRVRAIHRFVPNAIWNHVSGHENPADLASRGTSVKLILSSKLWVRGPDWLSSETFESNLVHVHSITSSSIFHDRLLVFILACSDFIKMRRLLAYWIRFVNNCKKTDRQHGRLSVFELKSSLLHLVRCVQQQSFHEEISRLNQQQPIRKYHLKSMSLFLDENGILRVGGRIRQSFYSYDKKQPMLLPKHHHFTEVVIRFYHETHHHAGPQLLLSLLREKFWIVRGQQMCSKIVRHCVVCCKANPQPLTQLMGQLPANRVNPGRPFTNVGVDYAGPFYLCVTPGRRPKIIKSYVCVFVCFAVKAVHLEFVGDLSTPSYVGAFKRFISRRGLPANIYCDGGRNFVGARNEIEEIQRFLSSSSHQQQLSKYFVDQEIHYHFNPPYGPHHGGIYEAAVKSMKLHLSKIVMDRKLSIEEFSTLLCQVEAALNSRPLCPMSSDPNDFSFISPGHFLTGGPLLAEPQHDLTGQKLHHLTRWQLVQQMSQHFFRRWSTQYIQSLQQKSKWFQEQPNLAVGQLVLVMDPETAISHQKWRLGRISSVHPGSDGLVRVCDVQIPVTTEKKLKLITYRRPITRISPLPVS